MVELPARQLIRIRPRQSSTQVSRGRTVFVCKHDGRVDSKDFQEGLYIYETRVLSKYDWLLNGKRPTFSCGSNVGQWKWLGYYIQAPENCDQTPTGECNPLQETIELRNWRSVGEGMREEILLINHTQIATSIRLELQYKYAFVSQTEAKEGRKQFGRLRAQWKLAEDGVWEQTADYVAQHRYHHQGDRGVAHFHRGMVLRIENASSAPKCFRNAVQFRAELPPHGTWSASICWVASVEGQLLPLPGGHAQRPQDEWDRRRTEFLDRTAFVSFPHDNDLTSHVSSILERSRSDLADLRFYDLDSPQVVTFAAGVPTYIALFGRDMQAAAWQAAIFTPDLLRGGMHLLAGIQATEENAWRDAQPGRLPHEIHTDPLSVLNFRPEALDFGGVSSDFLYPVLLSELWHWTGDLDAVRQYAETAKRALEWADRYSLDKTGFYRYQTHSEQGVKNQGWKDSGDAIVYPDGSQVEPPTGTCEMQGFMYAAKLQFSEIALRLGEIGLSRKLHSEAKDLKKRFNETFWMEDEGYIAMGIDAEGKQIRSVCSGAGHCLLSGIVENDRVKRVASRMLKEDLFSGWGIRTLSATHPAYNPFSYHRGSVWPVTNAAFVFAFARYGLYEEMHRLARSSLEAASLFHHDRLPELFGGHSRSLDAPFPGLYTEANWPQAWSASAAFAILQAILGIYPYAPANLLFVDPRLPDWLPEVTLHRLRIGKAIISMRFYRDSEGESHYEVFDQDGPLHVLQQPSPWSLTTEWGERIEDAVSSILPHHSAHQQAAK